MELEMWARRQIINVAENMHDCKLCSDVFFKYSDALKHVQKVHAKEWRRMQK